MEKKMRWLEARNEKNEVVKVRQCAKGNPMFVSDKEDYYNVTDLDFTREEDVERKRKDVGMPMMGSMMIDTDAYRESLEKLKEDNERRHYMELRGQVLTMLLANHHYPSFEQLLLDVRYIMNEIKKQDEA